MNVKIYSRESHLFQILILLVCGEYYQTHKHRLEFEFY